MDIQESATFDQDDMVPELVPIQETVQSSTIPAASIPVTIITGYLGIITTTFTIAHLNSI
jgi:hypothetical protein